MKRKFLAILLIVFTIICAACGKNETVSKSPEEQLFDDYTAMCGDISYEENYLAELIARAEDKLIKTKENDVANAAVLESLSTSLSEAKNYTKYTPVSLESENADVSSEMTAAEKAYNYLTKINRSLEDGIQDVDDSVYELDRIKEEKKAALIWPGNTFTMEQKDANGYVVEVKMKFGSWIKATDKENLNIAWKKAGGEGDAPDISTFYLGNYNFRGDNAVMTFATLEYTNKTPGYDFTEQYPYECNWTWCTSLYMPDSWKYSWQGNIYFSNGTVAMNKGAGRNTGTAHMTSNHWGPVPIAFAVANIFGPNFDENGDPALDEASFSFGGDAIKIPALWKTTEPITLAESDYELPYSYQTWDWVFTYGDMTEAGWEHNSQSHNKCLVIEYYRIEMGKGYYFHRGGNSEMSVNLSRLYTNFQGDITVPAESKENRGFLTVKIYGDDKLLWESEKITGSSSDIHFDIDVTDIHKLKIESVTDESNPGPSVAILNDIIS